MSGRDSTSQRHRMAWSKASTCEPSLTARNATSRLEVADWMRRSNSSSASAGFWLSLNFIYLFAVRLAWLPAGGYASFLADPGAALRFMVLPALSLGFSQSALIARITRSCMIEVLAQDYIRTARAKGLPQRAVVYVHAFRNALVPVVTVIGITMAILIGGAVVTEIVFNIPGLGRLVVSAILRRDYPVVQGVILVTAVAYVLINLGVDLVYALIDPRIRYD